MSKKPNTEVIKNITGAKEFDLDEVMKLNSAEYIQKAGFLANPHDYITVKGAREHNLKDVSIVIPKNRLVVFSGLSGSGKSSLVFDTIYAEGQRRYVESLSSYARQFLGLKEKPDVDSIDGLSPAISIDQKSTSHNPRSTVGTTTEIYDYLRLLYAKVGVQHDPETGEEIKSETVTEMFNKIMNLPKDTAIILLAPLVNDQKGWHRQYVLEAKKNGFRRMRLDGEILLMDQVDKMELNKQKKHSLEIVVDRVSVIPENKNRILDSLETTLKNGKGKAIVLVFKPGSEKQEKLELNKNLDATKLEPRQFSFNSPHGACEKCSGLGVITEIDPDLIVPNDSLSISEGCIKPLSRLSVSGGWLTKIFESLSKKHRFSLESAWRDLPEKIKHIIFYGDGKKFEGVITNLNRRYKETSSDASRRDIESYMNKRSCPVCGGARLKKESLAVTVGNKNIAYVSQLSITDCLNHFNVLADSEKTTLTKKEFEISKMILKEIYTRLSFLADVGLGYLTLSRSSHTLSGGEAQRIRLATQIGSGLTGVLYILDEPSIGLHQKDNEKLLKTLKHLRDLGNSVLVVEHDEETMRESDFLVDIGPRAGKNGGHVVAYGSPETVKQNDDSPTGRFLAGKDPIVTPKNRREVTPYSEDEKAKTKYIRILGARENNLKDVDLEIPLKKFVCITGVSGSGKSTLVNDIFANELMNYFYDSRLYAGDYDELEGLNYIDKPVIIDQSPIGRTPRSNPATYTGLFTPIRELFTSLPDSKARGYTAGRFSFNVPGGRCETCQGDGYIKVEMNFLPNVYVVCEDCEGKRYNRETLEITYREKNIHDILSMTVEDALGFFDNHEYIKRKLRTLKDVGLGYIHLGQSATTLSGGEAQRIKLATELSKVGTGNTLYILDEPTTGLHPLDVKKLLEVLQKLVDKGNTVVVIEHNLDVIKTADWIVDLGPEGGDKGGLIIATGTPEQVSLMSNSHTANYLKKVLEGE